MWSCPVCGKENKQLLCGRCGFDGSCDYERYPTLEQLSGNPDAVSRRKADRQTAEVGMLSCPNCGGRQFSVDFDNQMYLCSGCGHQFSPKKREHKTKEVSSEKTDKAQSFTERIRSAPRVGAFVIPDTGMHDGERTPKNPEEEKKQHQKKVKKPRPWYEIAVMLLGWAYIAVHLYFAIYVYPALLWLQFLLILIALAMQNRVRKNAYSAPFSNKVFKNFIVVMSYIASDAPGMLTPIVIMYIMLAFGTISMVFGFETFTWLPLVLFLGITYLFFWVFIMALYWSAHNNGEKNKM